MKLALFEIGLLCLYGIFNNTCFDLFEYNAFSKFTLFSRTQMLENCYTYNYHFSFIYYAGMKRIILRM